MSFKKSSIYIGMAISFQKLASFFVSIIEKEIPSIISESVF
jgi:hypothetical protein